MIRFGIAGFGVHAAQRLAPGFRLAKKSRLTALSRTSLEKAKTSAAEYKIALAFGSVDELCRSNEVDAILVSTPNALHHRDVLLALNCGKHVLCEKPMGLCSAECQEMIAVAEKQKLTLGVAQVFRFDDNMRQLREKLKAGEIGKLISARAEFSYLAADSPRTWITNASLSGGGSIADVGVHCIDSLRYILDDEVTRVYASAFRDQESQEVEAAAILNLEFNKGTIASVMVSMREQHRTTIELVGEKGRLLIEDGLDKENPASLGLKRYLSYARQIDAFANAIEQNIPFAVPGIEGLRNQLVLDAAYRSLQSGKAESIAPA